MFITTNKIDFIAIELITNFIAWYSNSPMRAVYCDTDPPYEFLVPNFDSRNEFRCHVKSTLKNLLSSWYKFLIYKGSCCLDV